MKVAIDARYLSARSSGVGSYTWNLINELGQLDPDLRFVIIKRKRGVPTPLPSDRYEELLLDVEPRSLAALYSLRWLLPKDVDLFHCLFNILPIGLRCPTITTIHDIMYLQAMTNITVDPLTWATAGLYWRATVSYAIRHADRLLTVSDATRLAIMELFGEHVSERIAVTPNGLDPFFLEADDSRDEELVTSVVGSGNRFVLVVGNLSRHKNHPNAVRGFLRATRNDPQMKLVLVRRSKRWDPEMSLLLRRPLREGRVIAVPEVSHETLRALYRRAELFLFPSTVEGFGIPIIEAMACGSPIVTSDRGAMAEVAGDAAELVDPYDVGSIARAIRRVLDDSAHREKLIALGRDRFRFFTWRRCAEKTLEAYRDLVPD